VGVRPDAVLAPPSLSGQQSFSRLLSSCTQRWNRRPPTLQQKTTPAVGGGEPGHIRHGSFFFFPLGPDFSGAQFQWPLTPLPLLYLSTNAHVAYPTWRSRSCESACNEPPILMYSYPIFFFCLCSPRRPRYSYCFAGSISSLIGNLLLLLLKYSDKVNHLSVLYASPDPYLSLHCLAYAFFVAFYPVAPLSLSCETDSFCSAPAFSHIGFFAH